MKNRLEKRKFRLMSDFYLTVAEQGIRGGLIVMMLHYWFLNLIIPLFPTSKPEQTDGDEIPF